MGFMWLMYCDTLRFFVDGDDKSITKTNTVLVSDRFQPAIIQVCIYSTSPIRCCTVHLVYIQENNVNSTLRTHGQQ